MYDFKENADAPTVENAAGGRQSAIDYDWTLVPWKGMLPVVKVLMEGAKKYGKDNWRKITSDDNVAHLLAHAIGAENTQGDDRLVHLTHVICRALFAIETQQAEEAAQKELDELWYDSDEDAPVSTVKVGQVWRYESRNTSVFRTVVGLDYVKDKVHYRWVVEGEPSKFGEGSLMRLTFLEDSTLCKDLEAEQEIADSGMTVKGTEYASVEKEEPRKHNLGLRLPLLADVAPEDLTDLMDTIIIQPGMKQGYRIVGIGNTRTRGTTLFTLKSTQPEHQDSPFRLFRRYNQLADWYVL